MTPEMHTEETPAHVEENETYTFEIWTRREKKITRKDPHYTTLLENMKVNMT